MRVGIDENSGSRREGFDGAIVSSGGGLVAEGVLELNRRWREEEDEEDAW